MPSKNICDIGRDLATDPGMLVWDCTSTCMAYVHVCVCTLMCKGVSMCMRERLQGLCEVISAFSVLPFLVNTPDSCEEAQHSYWC